MDKVLTWYQSLDEGTGSTGANGANGADNILPPAAGLPGAPSIVVGTQGDAGPTAPASNAFPGNNGIPGNPTTAPLVGLQGKPGVNGTDRAFNAAYFQSDAPFSSRIAKSITFSLAGSVLTLTINANGIYKLFLLKCTAYTVTDEIGTVKTENIASTVYSNALQLATGTTIAITFAAGASVCVHTI